jgi:hypothetical protein
MPVNSTNNLICHVSCPPDYVGWTIAGIAVAISVVLYAIQLYKNKKIKEFDKSEFIRILSSIHQDFKVARIFMANDIEQVYNEMGGRDKKPTLEIAKYVIKKQTESLAFKMLADRIKNNADSIRTKIPLTIYNYILDCQNTLAYFANPNGIVRPNEPDSVESWLIHGESNIESFDKLMKVIESDYLQQQP